MREIRCRKLKAFEQPRNCWKRSATNWHTRREMGSTRQLNASLHLDQPLMSLDALHGFDVFWIIGGVPVTRRWPNQLNGAGSCGCRAKCTIPIGTAYTKQMIVRV